MSLRHPTRHGRLLAGLILASFAGLALSATQASAFVPDGTHGWYWQLPQPAGAAGMYDLAFPTDSDVWSVGCGGLILHSSDAGASWTVQPTGTDADLSWVSFVDGLNGAASGEVVLVTHDGGATWIDKTPDEALADGFGNVDLVDATHAWVSTTDGAVLKTADGGDTWQRMPVGAHESYLVCDFVDASHGWACGEGGRIWRTVDGGTSWSLQTAHRPKDYPGRVEFIDRRHGWALDYSYWGDSLVRHTADGGRTWTRVRRSGRYTWMDATGPDSAWFVSAGWWWWGEDTTLARTDDVGRHWQTSALVSPVSPISVVAHGDAVCAAGDGVLLSSDAGATWHAASSGQQYAFADSSLTSQGDVWAVEYNGALLHSTDGARWVESDLPERWFNSFYGVCFLDSTNGWVVGTNDVWEENGVILHTLDGGKSWEPQASNLGGRLVGVEFVDASNGWAISDDPWPWGVGANTCMQRTFDGGATWIPVYVASGAALTDVDFLDASTGWAVGVWAPSEDDDLPAVFKTVNGGWTWTRHALPKGAPSMASVQFLDAATGWAVGTEYDWETGAATGWVVTTSDGGKTWSRVPDTESIHGTAVRFSDALHGWIGGDNGIFATSDAGATWRRVAGGWNATSIAAADPAHVWVFGIGSVLSTVDANGDYAAPATVNDEGAWAWSNELVTVSLQAWDIGGSGLASSQFKLDGDVWQSGVETTVDAPADHANDGEHLLYYRSTDNAGNREGTGVRAIPIDTLGPACGAPRKSIVDTGTKGILYFSASDATSGVERVVIKVRDARGRVAKRFVERQGRWSYDPPRPYYWLSFRCDLKPGTYKVEVRGFDVAGNRQVTVGRNTLRVVKSGAPRQAHPHWPEGLPWESYGFGSSRSGDRLDLRAVLRGGLLSPALVFRAGALRGQ